MREQDLKGEKNYKLFYFWLKFDILFSEY